MEKNNLMANALSLETEYLKVVGVLIELFFVGCLACKLTGKKKKNFYKLNFCTVLSNFYFGNINNCTH